MGGSWASSRVLLTQTWGNHGWWAHLLCFWNRLHVRNGIACCHIAVQLERRLHFILPCCPSCDSRERGASQLHHRVKYKLTVGPNTLTGLRSSLPPWVRTGSKALFSNFRLLRNCVDVESNQIFSWSGPTWNESCIFSRQPHGNVHDFLFLASFVHKRTRQLSLCDCEVPPCFFGMASCLMYVLWRFSGCWIYSLWFAVCCWLVFNGPSRPFLNSPWENLIPTLTVDPSSNDPVVSQATQMESSPLYHDCQPSSLHHG